MLAAEVEAAAVFAAVGVAAADEGQPSIDLLLAFWVVAFGGDAVADVPMPVAVVADAPAYRYCQCT